MFRLRALSPIFSWLFFLCLLVGTLRIILVVLGPNEASPTPPPVYTYDSAPLQASVSAGEISVIQDEILSFGSRLMGQPGFYQTERYIRDVYTKAGLEVHEQTNWTVAPVTDRREILRAAPSGDRPIEGVEVFPFLPNHLQPMNTPPEGLSGTLVLMTEQELNTRESFADCIALIDATEGAATATYNFDWTRYAQLGVKAVIVAHPEGLDRIRWINVAADTGGMVSSVPVNFVRLAATPEIFDQVGERITLHVRTRFAEVPNRTIVGILRAGKTTARQSNDQAILFLTNYDAMSILPDKAPGVLPAVPLAMQLALARGLAAYRETMVRDVVFVAFGAQFMARDGDNNLLKLLDENLQRSQNDPLRLFLGLGNGAGDAEGVETELHSSARLIPWQDRLSENQAALRHLDEILRARQDALFLRDAGRTEEIIQSFEPAAREFFFSQVQHVFDTIVFDLHEEMTQRKIDFLRAGESNLSTPEFASYQQTKRLYDRAVTAAGYRLLSLLRSEDFGKRFVSENDIVQLMDERVGELRAFHLNRQTHLEESLSLLRALLPYRTLVVMDGKIVPAPPGGTEREMLSFWDGDWGVKTNVREMASLLASAQQRLVPHHAGIGDRSRFAIPELSRWHSVDVDRNTRPISNLSASEWTMFGYHMYTFLNFGRAESYRHYAYPADLPFMRDVASVEHSIAVIGELVLSTAHGNGRFSPIQLGWLKKHFGGRVLASGIGQSMVPNYPLSGAVLSGRPFQGNEYSYPGFYDHPLIMTDPYGRYELFNTPSDFWVNRYIWALGYSPLAACYDTNGLISWMKDEGETGQRLYKSVNLNWFDAKVDNVTLVMFRASPVALLDTTNPQKMTDFTGVRLFDHRGLSSLGKHCQIRSSPDRGISVSFVEPEEQFFVALESGSPENDLAKVIRAFLLNMPGDWKESLRTRDSTREIAGPGYRGADAGILPDVPIQMARSIGSVNDERLTLQLRHGMADEQVLDYHAKAMELLVSAEQPGTTRKDSLLKARDSATYSMLNHPVLRSSLTEAVMGIMFYLALLVPFVFFFEKMLFCHTDVRKQLAAQIVIFLVVFALLRYLHPAFSMIRSSLMVLLGFAIILIAGSMTLLFSEKFKENLDELGKRRGHVSAAQINKLGVIGSAFMLGLNNMHRRKLRTALTCGTLTLMTFAMISFTSADISIVNENRAIGRAPYQGILLKKDFFQRFQGSEVFAIQAKYGDRFVVCPRKMSLGTQNWLDKQGYNPRIEVVHAGPAGSRSRTFNSIIQLNHRDPLQHQVRLVTNTGWFTAEQVEGREGAAPVAILPDSALATLGITHEEIEKGTAHAQINGRTFQIIGSFDPASLASARDLDNQSILPYDIENMSRIHTLADGEVLAEESAPRISPDRIILAPLTNLNIEVPNEKPDSNTSIALYMPEGETRQVRREIDTFLEQSERPAYYGLNNIAYRGQRTRKPSITGMMELIVPLLIVALTVLNTMKGSVYERRSEIAVYNAVGIAPRYVFFMFVAEALVYTVVGSLLGYLLSQGVGKFLTVFDLTGGMRMTFTSITTIYASLAVGATALASTWFPARTAMNIARPAEDAGWKLPEPEGDTLAFDLPFTFGHRDRMAVLAFCNRFLEEHGEGGSGGFFCLPPGAEILNEGTAAIPVLRSTVWLKPYDLGVSQFAEFSMPHDPETEEFKARVSLVIASGSRDAWLRLNKRFVAEVRRQFLHWRAVPESDRAALFEEARRLYLSPSEKGGRE